MEHVMTDQVVVYLTNKLRDDRERIISVSYASLGMLKTYMNSADTLNYAWELAATIVMQYLNIDFKINDYKRVIDAERGLIDIYKLPHPFRPGGGNETDYSKMKHIMQMRCFLVPGRSEHRAKLAEVREELEDKVQKS